MVEAMNEAKGVGLAANQVGISKRFFIMKVDEEVKLFINPEIINMGEMNPFEEGCLSIPGVSAATMRALEVKLKYLDEFFDEHVEEFKDLKAAAIQHEVDHLDGKLYVDQLLPVRKKIVLDKHRKFLKTRGKK
jgi:peptide deformylase